MRRLELTIKDKNMKKLLAVCVTLVLIGPPLSPHRGRSSCAPPTTTSGTPSSRSACPLPHPPAPSSTASRPAWAARTAATIPASAASPTWIAGTASTGRCRAWTVRSSTLTPASASSNGRPPASGPSGEPLTSCFGECR